MKNSLRCFLVVTSAAMFLAGCGNKETKEALKRSTDLENQKQYQDANDVLTAAIQAREDKIRAGAPAPTDQASVDAESQKEQADSEILKLERAQIPIYLRLDRPDLAAAVDTDILSGHPGDTVVNDLLNDSDPVIRAGAVRMLGYTAKPDSIDALVKAMQDSEKDVRRYAVVSLGSIKDPRTVPPLIDALKDSYWFVRSDAAEALGAEKDPRAVKPLLDAVADSDDTAEAAAENALIQLCEIKDISHDDFVARLSDPNTKIVLISSVCLALLHDTKAVPVLVKLAGSSDRETRLHAIKALGETGDSSVAATLRQTLKDTDPDVRGWSIIGLGKLKDQDSIATLQVIAADPNELASIRSAAAGAVAHITGQDVNTTPPPSGP